MVNLKGKFYPTGKSIKSLKISYGRKNFYLLRRNYRLFIILLFTVFIFMFGLSAILSNLIKSSGKKAVSNGSAEAASYSLSNQEEKVNYDEITYDKVETDKNTIKINNNFGDVNIYGWNRDEIKFEIDCYCDKKSEKQNCCYSINRSDNEISFSSKHNTPGKKINMKVFVPQKIKEIILVNKNGDTSISNDLHTNIDLKTEAGNVNIHSLHGGITLEITKGNADFINTNLDGKTKIKLLKGNISFEGEISESADISMNTEFGNIKLDTNNKGFSNGVFYNGITEKKVNAEYNPNSNVKLFCTNGRIIFN